MKKFFSFVFAALFATPCGATINSPVQLETVIVDADIIAHIEPTRIEVREINGTFCGLSYVAEVIDSLHGELSGEISFIASRHTGNLNIAEHGIVFLKRAQWRNGYWDQFPLALTAEEQENRAMNCGDEESSFFEMGYATLPYSLARLREMTDEETEYFLSKENPEAMTSWWDRIAMLRIPPLLTFSEIANARHVSVSSIELDGEVIKVEDLSDRWLWPTGAYNSEKLFSASRIKSLIREIKNANKNEK